MALLMALIIITSTLLLLRSLLIFLNNAWWTPITIQKIIKSQGIKGLPYTFPHGNTKVITAMRNQSMSQPMDTSHEIFARIQPHVYSWIKTYGMNFVNWHGSQAQIFVTEPELVKEILNNREGAYPKMDMEGYAKKLLGEALITNEGEKWAKVRKLANHTFHAESLKNMIPEMSRSIGMMLENWKDYEGKEIDVHKEFGLVTTEVISRTAFGSSYVEGKHIFEMVAKLTAITVRNIYALRFPGISLITKTDDEIEAEKLEKAIKKSILDIVDKRKANADDFGNDYLGQLVKIANDANDKKRITVDQMIDEIKAIYGAGHLTTTNLLSWTVFLLATNQEWQEKVREEVLELFGRETPTSDGIARLKTDVHCFLPDRFANGVAKATKNNAAAFLPFGMGPRTCVGLNFTTNEAKIALSMILQRYKLSLSSNYVHYPADVFILTPKKGVQVILHKELVMKTLFMSIS
ncbi:hypothetical protein L2E82_14071 [Cichorium intybus]|uniref:Uncharacterized protein n=1 Tax=Cichorium intybus TaxID=13427 RepID=A0ACB9EZA9_CICIN|nr:hypothetical protein L2E82_14071 [Cichorium intybus]